MPHASAERTRQTRLLIALFLLADVDVVRGQQGQPSQMSREHRLPTGIYVKGIWASLARPGFHDQTGGEDGPVVPQSSSTYGIGAGYEHFVGRGGLYAGLFLSTSMAFKSFAFTPEGFGQQLKYADPNFRLGGIEFGGHWFWSERIPVSSYAMFNIAVVSESYTVSGASFPFEDWNGKKSYTGARPALGLGVPDADVVTAAGTSVDRGRQQHDVF